jgi:hypothetical protein
MMKGNDEEPKPIKFIRDLCEDLTEEELKEAENNFRAYLLLVKQICTRKENDECGFGLVDESEII